jgi:acetyl esterase/lipase
VLYYSRFPKTEENSPLAEASMAIAYIRRNAKELDINPDKIYAVGFSAGGHLAGSPATLWHREDIIEKAQIEYGENKPTAVVLCYPVISAEQIGKKPHLGSFHNLLCKKELSREDIDAWSLEKHVDEKSAPAFIIHTAEDGVVPVENSLVMGRAYADAGIQFEMHIYPHGPHGGGLALPNNHGFWTNSQYARWVDDSIYFFEHLK